MDKINKLVFDIVTGLAGEAIKQMANGSSSKNIATAGSGCYYITDACVACGTCASECPVNAKNTKPPGVSRSHR
ncbi:MAG: 4Fe-4S binding protein [Paludibacteraceae bacterium]|nr:4Fe-4S binding protein [Paludibacteraceae bacterium]